MTMKKDLKGRNLRQNEDQMKDGRYRYRYTDRHGNRNAVYSWKLVPTDKTPAGKRDDISLREKEKQIEKDLDDGIIASEANITVEELIARYLETKVKLADTTLENYKHIFQMAVDDDIIRKNPCMGCMKDYPRGSLGSNKEALTVAEQEELLKFARNSVIYEKYYVLLAFLLFTGLIRTTL